MCWHARLEAIISRERLYRCVTCRTMLIITIKSRFNEVIENG